MDFEDAQRNSNNIGELYETKQTVDYCQELINEARRSKFYAREEYERYST